MERPAVRTLHSAVHPGLAAAPGGAATVRAAARGAWPSPDAHLDGGAMLGCMNAAVLHEIPGSLVIEDVDIDRPGPREVLVRTSAAGLCHSDLHFLEGKFSAPTPLVLGHESAGVV